MKADVQLAMITAKVMDKTEEALCFYALVYSNGEWPDPVWQDDLDAEFHDYMDDHPSDLLVNFCLDYMSGKIPPNKLQNRAVMFLERSKKKKTPPA